LSQQTVKNGFQNRGVNQARCPDTRGHFKICPDGCRAEEGGKEEEVSAPEAQGEEGEEEVSTLEAQGEEAGGGEEGGEKGEKEEVPRFEKICEKDQGREEGGEEGKGGEEGGEEEISPACAQDHC